MFTLTGRQIPSFKLQPVNTVVNNYNSIPNYGINSEGDKTRYLMLTNMMTHDKFCRFIIVNNFQKRLLFQIDVNKKFLERIFGLND